MLIAENTYFQNLKAQSFIFKWHIDKLLDNLEFQSVLDIGGIVGATKDFCINDEVKNVYVVDPGCAFIKVFSECKDDGRFNFIKESIENVDFENVGYDIVFLLMNFQEITDPSKLIKKLALNDPDYFLIANQKHTSARLKTSNSTKLINIIKKIFKNNKRNSSHIDEILELNGYYPLIVQNTEMLSSVLYTKDKPDREVYNKAKYIIQVNSSCNFNCPSCYVDKLGITMTEDTFNNILNSIYKKDVISLRGGEPTLSENLISGFIKPALHKGAHVILETNGSFIGRSQYNEYLKTFSDENTAIRLSLDRPHMMFLSSYERQLEHLNNIIQFIKDAKRYNIKLSLVSLGMDKKQISKLLGEFSAKEYMKYIRPITRYLDIKDLRINGKFIDIHGNVFKKISGISYSEFDKGQSF